MRILVISDIHANLSALETVISIAGNVDAVWCLGDIVGYGPDPNKCISIVRNLPNLTCIKGNHDAAVLGELDQHAFNHEASLAITWTKHALTADSKEFLLGLPERIVNGKVTLVHGSPRNPVWEYIMDYMTAMRMFQFFDTQLCMIGHTHVPTYWEEISNSSKTTVMLNFQKITISGRAILNPGSVGQPRDHDPRASFAFFDPESSTWELRRVEYDIHSVQERIKKAGLPLRHALRLNEGW